MICVCISHDCKLDLVTIRGHQTGDQYIRDVLQPVVPHFDNHHYSCKTCVYGWQHQAASLKGSNRLSSKWSLDISSMASHDPGLESNRACLGHARPSCTGSWTSYTKFSQLKQQCIGNGCSYHRSTSDDWLGEWDSRLRPSSKHVVVSLDNELSTLDVVKWLKIDVFQVKWQSYRALWTVKVNT